MTKKLKFEKLVGNCNFWKVPAYALISDKQVVQFLPRALE